MLSCLRAGTVHLGGTFDEVAASERAPAHGVITERPFVLISQPTLLDPTRAPAGKHVALISLSTCRIAGQAQRSKRLNLRCGRFAPGFRECILWAGRPLGTRAMQAWNKKKYTWWERRPTAARSLVCRFFSPSDVAPVHGLPLPGVYLCSSSTPPGGAVHGMCGYWAAQVGAQTAIKDLEHSAVIVRWSTGHEGLDLAQHGLDA